MKFDVGVVATHITPALGFGGVAVSSAKLTNAWAKNPERKIGLSASNGSEDGNIRSEDVLKETQVQVKLFHTYWFKKWGFGLGAISQIFRLCALSKFVYIHGIATWPSTIGAVFCCLLSRPFCVAPRGGLMPEHVMHIRKNKPLKWIYYQILTFPTLRNAKFLHCTGKIEADAARSYLNKHLPVLILPNGLTLKPQNQIPTISDKKGLILSFVGRISFEKGINSFLKIWLKMRQPEDRFLIAGSNSGNRDSYFQEFQNLVQQSEDAIDYRGYLPIDKVEKLICESHFLVLPSGLEGGVRENFGNTVAEAMALCRPAMTCRGLVWDDIESEHAGYVFDREPGSVKDVIQRAQSSSISERRSMGFQSRKYAEKRLDLTITADKIWNALTTAKTFQNGTTIDYMYE